MEKQTIKCPHCGKQIELSEIITHQYEEKYQEELKKKTAEIEKQVEEKLRIESEKQAKEIKKTIEKEYSSKIELLQEENESNKKQITDLNKTKIENEKLKRKLELQETEIELKYEQILTEKLKEETNKIRENESSKLNLLLRERDQTIKSMANKIDDLQKKATQGSMQLQGEVQELILEEMLKELFVNDLIEEVGKGIKGADVVHTVKNKFGVECGKIIYESKRTKSFGNDWISKLKSDALKVKGDICVIVTEAMPECIEKFGLIDNVWICSFREVKGLVTVLRESLIKIYEAYASQTNKGEKMQMLYDYLMSNEFRLQITAILDGFNDMQDSLVKEKRETERRWKMREKQLEKVLINTNHFVGSLQGIAGNSIPELKLIGEEKKLLNENLID